ncbi:MAG: hypothetical protein HQ572_02495 [Candidatus Omnitrophica bacterium]|nr:hypothetical protein [Candidatus Omnitrophota bacterium]
MNTSRQARARKYQLFVVSVSVFAIWYLLSMAILSYADQLRPIAAKREPLSRGGRTLSGSLRGYDGESAERKSSGAGFLKIPGQQIEGAYQKVQSIIDSICRPHEKDSDTIVAISGRDWASINHLMLYKGLREYSKDERPVLHVIDTKKEKSYHADLFGFPLVERSDDLTDSAPAVSYVSEDDKKLHIFVTKLFYLDFLQITEMRPSIILRRLQIMRLAELIDHEVFEHSKEAERLPLDGRHHQAALRSRYFIPGKEQISSYHKWIIDALALSSTGRDYQRRLLVLDASRPTAVETDQALYENNFYKYLEDSYTRGALPNRTCRHAYHILRAYRHGDMQTYNSLCEALGIDSSALDMSIREREERDTEDLIAAFRPDTVLRDSAEMVVATSTDSTIVEKTPKNESLHFVDTVFHEDNVLGMQYIRELSEDLSAGRFVEDFSIARAEDRQKAAYLFDLYKIFILRPQDHSIEENLPQDACYSRVYRFIYDYANRDNTDRLDAGQEAILASYRNAQNILGGLIAEFVIIRNKVYQEKVVPLDQYLAGLNQGTGPCASFRDTPAGLRQKISIGMLIQCLECFIEAAKRGLIISDFKLENFGVRDDGSVVLIDLGSATFSGISHIDAEERRCFVNRLERKLDSLANEDAARPATARVSLHRGGMNPQRDRWDHLWEQIKEVTHRERERLQLTHRGLSSYGRIDRGGYHALDACGYTLSTVAPSRQAEATAHRRTTFVPTHATREGMLQLIMQEVIRVTDGPMPAARKSAPALKAQKAIASGA